ncbi:MAG: ornithine cyclodeaminase family protein [Thermoanaerobaculales bacterium]|jgi:ornithine cyclodeaminase|nr:ornithine cyclodeaminase family protein [Thermoanaerobaculales bacterium]
MKLRVLGAAALRESMPMADTIEAMKGAFAAYSSGVAVQPQRLAVRVPPDESVLLVKPALLPDAALGAKLISVFPGNRERGLPVITGVVVVLDPATGEPAGLCDGGFLTAWRTGAASGAATDLLARDDAVIGAVVGCGVQGRTQALAMDTVRRLQEIRIFDAVPAQAEAFVEEMAPRLRARLVAAASADEAVDGADVVCAATTTTEPVIRGARLVDGAHLNGVGSFTPAMCEVDDEVIRRARIVVDSREAALSEAGELIAAAQAGLTDPAEWVELGEIVGGTAPGRSFDGELTFFKSVGLAVQDMAAAALAFRNAERLGLGDEIDLS